MKNKQFIAGILIGILTGYVAAYFIFLMMFKSALPDGFNFYLIHQADMIAPCLQLGLLLNGGLFFLLLKFNKDYIARGVLAATILGILYILFAIVL